MTTYPFFLRIKQRVEKQDSKRAKSTGENKIISFFFFFKDSGPSLAGLGA